MASLVLDAIASHGGADLRVAGGRATGRAPALAWHTVAPAAASCSEASEEARALSVLSVSQGVSATFGVLVGVLVGPGWEASMMLSSDSGVAGLGEVQGAAPLW